jgi:hypothetical protein
VHFLFKKDTIGPEPPVLISPLNNGQTLERKPVHYWLEPTDPSSNEISQYHVQIDTQDTFTTLLVDSTTSTLTFSHDLELPIGEYYWRVSGIDVVGNIGAWSTPWNFKIVTMETPEVNLPPTAVAGEDKVAFVDEVVLFNASGSSDPEDDELIYLWHMDDDTEPDAKGIEINWRYKQNGTYIVILEVFDAYGGYDYDALQVTILDFIIDSDDDGMSDDWENYYGLDPTDPKDAIEDSDNDGYLNNMEFNQGSAPQDELSTPITANDKTPPKITHKRIVKGQQLIAITITATVTDEDSGVKEVNLYYKKKSDLSYNSISMGHENTYSATIPGSMVTLDDLEYYIEAVDNSKLRNTAYFGDDGQSIYRPSSASDIDVDVKENIINENEPDMFEDLQDTFKFNSVEVCFTVFVIMIILLISFGLSLSSVVKARQLASANNQRKVISVTHGKNMVWEGFDLENISEDEDMNLINDDSELEEI